MIAIGGPRDGAELNLPAERDREFKVPVPTPATFRPEGVDIPSPGISTACYRIGMGDRGEPIAVYVPDSHDPAWW